MSERTNQKLRSADKKKKDEFYTQACDIENELRHYKEQFKDKVVFCNCDDPFESEFFKYFAKNFNFLELKKLIATCYDDSPIAGEQLSLFDLNYKIDNKSKKAYKIIINEVADVNGDGAIDITDVKELIKNKKNTLSLLKEDGDFRSQECIELLKQSDIVVTNPPFSLFREYVAQLFEYNKKFLIIGSVNAISYKEIFPLIKDNKMWIGYKFNGAPMMFRIPKKYTVSGTVTKMDEYGNALVGVGGTCWFTNLDVSKRHEKLDLYKKYTPDEFPKFDNYDAININKTVDIPCDYYGLMGVPVTFIDKYNPEQFKIIDGLHRYAIYDYCKTNEYIQSKHLEATDVNGKSMYFRVVIQRIDESEDGEYGN